VPNQTKVAREKWNGVCGEPRLVRLGFTR